MRSEPQPLQHPVTGAGPGKMPSVLAVTDTHSLLWYAGKQHRKLGRAALAHFQRADASQAAVYVPAMVLAEVSELARLRRIQLPTPFGTWLDEVFANKCIIAQPLTAAILRRAHDLCALPDWRDRLVAATAAVLEVPLITRDPAIADCARVEPLWD